MITLSEAATTKSARFRLELSTAPTNLLAVGQFESLLALASP